MVLSAVGESPVEIDLSVGTDPSVLPVGSTEVDSLFEVAPEVDVSATGVVAEVDVSATGVVAEVDVSTTGVVVSSVVGRVGRVDSVKVFQSQCHFIPD